MSDKKKKPVSRAYGFGVEVGGPRPYVAFFFSVDRETAQKACTQPYHKVVRVRIQKIYSKKASKK